MNSDKWRDAAEVVLKKESNIEVTWIEGDVYGRRYSADCEKRKMVSPEVTDEETFFVFAHEVGHIKHNHPISYFPFEWVATQYAFKQIEKANGCVSLKLKRKVYKQLARDIIHGKNINLLFVPLLPITKFINFITQSSELNTKFKIPNEVAQYIGRKKVFYYLKEK